MSTKEERLRLLDDYEVLEAEWRASEQVLRDLQAEMKVLDIRRKDIMEAKCAAWERLKQAVESDKRDE